MQQPQLQALADEAELRRLSRVKHREAAMPDALGPELIAFFKQSVQKRQTKLTKIAACWERLVPEILNEHCSLEGFNRGTLTVLIDSASHLYELKQLLLAGLQHQLLIACKGAGLRKIQLKRGKWYDDKGGDGGDSQRRTPRF